MLTVPSAVNSAPVTEHVGSAAETVGQEKDVGVTSRRHPEGGEVIDADGNAGSFK